MINCLLVCKKVRGKSLLSILIISILLSSCILPSRKAAVVSESTPESQVGATKNHPTKLELPPTLVETEPIPGSQIGISQDITFTFNQPMDRASVEAAITSVPSLGGDFAWFDDQTVSFSPDQPYIPESKISITINEFAKATNGKNLQDRIDLSFQVTPFLILTSMLPMDSTTEVDPSTNIVAAFNQPVISLGEDDHLPAFSIYPSAEGKGEWVNTSTYVFYPEPSLMGGTIYTVNMDPQLTSVLGTRISGDAKSSWSFSTALPEVLSISPVDELLELEGPVVVNFNIRMDTQAVEKAFSLVDPQNRVIKGRYEWNNNQTQVSFIPLQQLPRNVMLTARVDSTAKSYGGKTLSTIYHQTFMTYPELEAYPISNANFKSYSYGYGQLRLYFTTPLDRISAYDSVKISPEVSSTYIYFSDKDMTLAIGGYFEPATEYTITLESTLKDKWGDQLPQRSIRTLYTPNADPSFSIELGGYYYGYTLAFLPTGRSEMIAQATNISYLTIGLGRMSYEEFLWYFDTGSYEGRQNYLPEDYQEYTKLYSLPANKSQIINVPLILNGASLTPGIYFVQVLSPEAPDMIYGNEAKFVLVVSDYNTVLKISANQAFLWVSDAQDNSGLRNTPVTIVGSDGSFLSKGVTDKDGFFTSEIPYQKEIYYSYFAVVGDPTTYENFTLGSTRWGSNFLSWDLGLRVDHTPEKLFVYTYTERPIYRPGQTVYFKSIIRDVDNSFYSLPEPGIYRIEVNSDSYISQTSTLVYSTEQNLSGYGTLSGEFTIPSSASPGWYTLRIFSNDEELDEVYLQVANYRKPEIEMQLTLTPDEILPGNELTGSIQSDYYFGVPAANLEVSWNLYAREHFFSIPGYKVGSFDNRWMLPSELEDDDSKLGKFIFSGKGSTDQLGRLEIKIPASVIGSIDMVDTFNISLEATITDASGFSVSQRDSVLMHPETYYVGIKPNAYFSPAATPIEYDLLTIDWEGSSVPGKAIQATFSKIDWEVVGYEGIYNSPKYKMTEEVIGTASPSTSDKGIARLSFTPINPGTYMLTLISGKAKTQVMTWVGGSSAASWPKLPNSRLELVADSEVYEPGQNARIFIPNPFSEGAIALVTIERGEVMFSELKEISGSGVYYDYTIQEQDVPNIYFSVIIYDKSQEQIDYRQGVINLPVSPKERILLVNAEITPSITEPGKDVSLKINVKNGSGDPVQGEFSVALIDKAILALMKPNELPITEAFYGNQPISVVSGLTMASYAAQMSLQPVPLGGKGGGGGEPSVREEFPDTAYWNGTIVTGKDGEAILTIPLPDNLTTWFVTIRGITDTSLVGETTAEIVTQKQLMIRPETPRFLVAGDHLAMLAIVHNNTDLARDVDVGLQAIGFRLDETTSQTQKVHIPANSSLPVTWMGVVESTSEVSLIFSANSKDLQDASKPTWGDLPVLRYVTPIRYTTSGYISESGTRLEVVSIPSSFLPEGGELNLVISPSLVSIVLDGLEALDELNYADNVTLASRLVSNIETYKTLSAFSNDDPDRIDKLITSILISINKLSANQNYDGGWSWMTATDRARQSDAITTAYVYLALKLSLDASFHVDQFVLDSARDYLENAFTYPTDKSDPAEMNRLTFLAYVIEGTQVNSKQINSILYQNRSVLSPWAQAMLALTLRKSNSSDTRIKTLISDLESKAIRTATSVHWESLSGGWFLPGSPGFSTAMVVQAIAEIDPAAPLLVDGLRYLISIRQSNNLWNSSFESAWIIKAINAAIRGTGDLQANYTFQAKVNDVIVASGETGSLDSLTPVSVVVPLNQLYKDWPNGVEITRSEGLGRLYYRTDLLLYRPAGTAEPVNKGISLSRNYYLDDGCVQDCQKINSVSLKAGIMAPLIRAELTLVVPGDMYNVIIEDFIPSGSEIFDPSLLTSQQSEQGFEITYEDTEVNRWGWWYFNSPNIYDDHIQWSTDYLPAGTYKLSYYFLPFQEGQFQVIPAHAWQFYFPEVEGTSAGNIFSIIKK